MNPYDKKTLRRFETLLEIMDRLRSPDGCPWDREQTRKTLRPYILEEAYEVVEAIDAEDEAALKEELGDLLLQIVFHARIGSENSSFTIEDVLEGINSKLVRRHPHVFGDTQATDADTVLANWNAIKRAEKGEDSNRSILDGVPGVLPALLKAITYSRRAAQVGFDWDRPEDVIEKLREETAELEEIVQSGDEEALEDEIGDVLFVIANLARRLKVNPELALERANRKFRRRFGFIEKRLHEQGRKPQDSDLKEMDILWDEAKKTE